MAVVVTVTQPAVTVTPTSTSPASSTLTSTDIAGIVVGALLGCVLLAVFAFYLHRRCRHHRFTQVPNPHDSVPSSAPVAPTLVGSPRAKPSIGHSQKPSTSSEPLIAPLSWPPIPLTSRVHSPSTPSPSDSVSPGLKESQLSVGEVTLAAPAILNIPPLPIPEQTSSSPKPQQTLFVHRMLQSRARASDSVSSARHPSFDSGPGRSATVDSETTPVDVEQLLADVERAALQDAQVAQKEDDDWEQVSTSESVYSQLSAPHDEPAFPPSRQNSSVVRRKSSRRRLPTTELTPVTEMPDTPRGWSDTLSIGPSPSLDAQVTPVTEIPDTPRGRPLSIGPSSSLDAQISHGTQSPPMSLLDDSTGFPLLTSVNFGTESAPTLGSITSTAGLGSNSSGRASRYPSLAPSSIGQSSQSDPRSDGGTDWRHPPPGLSGLKTLQIGPLRNPHSPLEERAERPFRPDPEKLAHLRRGTTSSVPEVERRAVVGSGIAHIDVVL